MGCCLGRSNSSESDDMENAITIGKNRPLIQERIKWKSDVPMTEGQLRSKRDEFWETAPAFEGRKEIWDALRAASALAEQGDYALSQAILDGANISLPDGTLRESYDELGNRYQVPYYCLSAPTNLLEERSSESSGGTMNGDGPNISSTLSTTDKDNRPGSSTMNNGQNAGELITLKLRLSTTSEDVSVDCHSRENVHVVKQRLHSQFSPTVPPANQQRWFYGGRILLDKMKIADCRIPPNFVVQVVINTGNTGKTGSGTATNEDPIDHVTTIDSKNPEIDHSITSTTKKEKTSAQIHALSIDQNHQIPNVPPSPDRRTGSSSSSRKSHGGSNKHNSARKVRSNQSSSANSTTVTTTTTTTGTTVNGRASSTSLLQQQRCNSFNSKRSNESPTPVETS